MQINGLQIPDRFMRCVNKGEFAREVGSWGLRITDAYGNHFESEVGEIYGKLETISRATSDLSKDFVEDGCYGAESDYKDKPGFIPDIVDFSKIVCFGTSSDGSPFCFDFRKCSEPSVIWWDDTYWRRVAPDFASFIQLIVR